MPEQIRPERDADLEGRVGLLEASFAVLNAATRKLDEIHAAIIGTATEPGLGERIRALEGFARVVKGAALACGTAVAVAWALVAAAPLPPHP